MFYLCVSWVAVFSFRLTLVVFTASWAVRCVMLLGGVFRVRRFLLFCPGLSPPPYCRGGWRRQFRWCWVMSSSLLLQRFFSGFSLFPNFPGSRFSCVYSSSWVHCFVPCHYFHCVSWYFPGVAAPPGFGVAIFPWLFPSPGWAGRDVSGPDDWRSGAGETVSRSPFIDGRWPGGGRGGAGPAVCPRCSCHSLACHAHLPTCEGIVFYLSGGWVVRWSCSPVCFTVKCAFT